MYSVVFGWNVLVAYVLNLPMLSPQKEREQENSVPAGPPSPHPQSPLDCTSVKGNFMPTARAQLHSHKGKFLFIEIFQLGNEDGFVN